MLSTRNIKFGIAGLVLSTFATTAVFGQLNHPQPADRNAAIAYSAVFYTALTKDLTSKVDAVEYKDVVLGQPLDKQPEAFRAAAEEVGSWTSGVNQLMRATRMARCDFELPYENGINVLMPHLSMFRKSARLLRFDARRLLIEGKADEAAERVAAIYRMAGHVKSDEILIGTLVSVAIAGLGNSESEVLIKSGKLSASGRESILQAAESLGAADPYGFKGALRGERRITVGWVRAKYKGPEAGKHFVDDVEKDWGMIPGSKPEFKVIAQMDERALNQSLDQLDGYHDLIESMWDLPDAPARLEVLGSRIEKGDFGACSTFMAPAISRACAASKKAAAELDQATKALKQYVPPVAPANRK